MKKAYLSFTIGGFLFLAGCANNNNPETIDYISNWCEKSFAMKTSQKVLTKMNFPIEKFDIEEGYIRTKPISGSQIFEFWQKDNVGLFNTVEANLHTIRRVIELDLSEIGGRTKISCNVKTYRLSIEESETAKISESPALFSANAQSSLEKLELPDGRKRWIELGNDEKLSSLILEEINKRLR